MKFTVNGVESEFYLESQDGSLDLKVKDFGGVPWFVTGITTGGKLSRHPSVPNHFGFKLTKNGKVKVDKNTR